MQKLKTAWLFDVDGVLSNPISKKIDEKQIFNEFLRRLKEGDIIGINTGRSIDYISEGILDPLEQLISDRTILRNIIALGEKGAALITYSQDGTRLVNLDSSVSIPNKLQLEVKNIAGKYPYSTVMFDDSTKKTMLSFEMKTGANQEEFKELQSKFVADLNDILVKMNLSDDYEVGVFRISTDIQSKNVGKAFATKKFVEILTERQIVPSGYFCFGDDTADYEMFEELKRLGKKVKFVFVGEKERLEGKNLESVIFTKETLDKGTLEYLQQS